VSCTTTHDSGLVATPRALRLLPILFILSAAGNGAAAQDRTSEAGCATAIVLPAECYRRLDRAARGEAAARAPDHRYEGLAIGAGAGAVLGVLGGLAVCGQSDDPDKNCAWWAVQGGLGLGALGGLTGLLIGGLFPKEDKESVPADSIPRDTVPP
jgi:hypothetical protein